MANLYDIIHGAAGLCQQYRSAYSLQQIPEEPLTVCDTYIASITFCSLIVFTFMITTWIAWKVQIEKKSKVQHVKKVKIIKYLQNSESKEAARFIRIEQHGSVNEKVVLDVNCDLEMNKVVNGDDCKQDGSIC
ncbi:3104_t:CDS:1 [Cetraspora pellucida]|uniref:3104_t:CDS:1 n=1 Tax=Cetraspora pellucida TaxID=1433469 RepID=A0A9N8Z1A2_9GLOM|nr:3104_t:CDS:1 [Cetraspora pellucida]